MFSGKYSIKRSDNFEAVEDFLRANFSAPTHWPEWNQWVAEDSGTNFFYWLLYLKENLIGVCPVHESIDENGKTELVSGQYKFIPYGGWILADSVDLNDIPSATKFQEVFQAHCLPSLPEFGIRYPTQEGDMATLVLSLANKSEDDLWTQVVHSKRRNMIRKAEKVQINVKEVETEQEFQDFYRAYQEASERNDLSLLPQSFFHRFLKARNIKLRLLNAYKDGLILSNVGLVLDKNYAIYWLGNNANDTRNEGQGELLQWEAMKLALAEGCSYYDLCYIEPERLPQIYKFKKGFAKEEVAISVQSQKSLLTKAVRKIQKF